MFGKELISALQAEYFVAYLLHLRVLPKTFYVAKSRPGQDIAGLNGKLHSFSLEFCLLSLFQWLMKQRACSLVRPVMGFRPSLHTYIHYVYSSPLSMCSRVYVHNLYSWAARPSVYNNERSHPFFSQHFEVACALLEQLNSVRREGWRREGWIDGGSEMQLNVYSRLWWSETFDIGPRSAAGALLT